MNNQNAPTCSEDLGNTKPSPAPVKKINEAKKWVFTWNNYENCNNWRELLQNMINLKCKKAIYGQEIAPTTKTPHLQGAIELKIKARPTSLGLPKSIHWELMRGTWEDNHMYCSKDGKYEKFGFPKPLKLITTLLPWQQQLFDLTAVEPDERTINWVFDPIGHNGKTVFCKFLIEKTKCIVATAGGAKDIANLLINEVEGGTDLNDNTTFIFNFSRDCDRISYNALEAVKDGLMTNIKYEAKTLVFNCPHVWVFSNQYPDKSKLSADRWKIWSISESKTLIPTISDSVGLC